VAVSEPLLDAFAERCRDDPEGELRFLEGPEPQPGDELPETGVVVGRKAVPDEPPRAASELRGREDVVAGETVPELLETSDAVERRIVRDGRTVQGPDRATDDDVRTDPALEERPQLADLDRAEIAAAAQDEGRP